MLIKFLGAFFVVFACTAWGLMHNTRQRNSICAVRELSVLFTEIARSISFQLEPLPLVIGRLSCKDNPPASVFLQHLKSSMDAGISQPMEVIWKDALSVFAKETQLPSQATEIAHVLGNALGKTDCETEVKRLIDAASELKELEQEMKKDSARTEKAVRSLGVLLGLFIVIILL